jgi:hypothetical protein
MTELPGSAAGLREPTVSGPTDAAFGKEGHGKSCCSTLAFPEWAAAGKVLGWPCAKLGGRARESLDELEAAPADADNQADRRRPLKKALEADPRLAEELRALIPAEAGNRGDGPECQRRRSEGRSGPRFRQPHDQHMRQSSPAAHF